MTSVAGADDRTDALVRIAEAYSAKRRVHGPPGTYEPAIENLEFALYAIVATKPKTGGDLTVSEWGYVLQQLQHEGFRFDYRSPPFQGRDLPNLVDARSRGELTLLRGLVLQYAKALVETRRSYPVPFTEVAFRPTIPGGHLPTTLAAIPPSEDGKIGIVLNQRAGQLRRLTASLELIAQTEIGRELLRDLLPQLKNGEIRIESLTDEIRRTKVTNLADGETPGAMYEPTIEWDAAHGRYRMRGTIYVDPAVELGTLTEHLFHEARHATDPKYRELQMQASVLLEHALRFRQLGQIGKAEAKEAEALKLLKQANTATECYAYQGQQTFKKQLGEAFPQAQAYYHGMLQRGESQPPVTPEFLASAYGIKAGSCLGHLAGLAP